MSTQTEFTSVAEKGPPTFWEVEAAHFADVVANDTATWLSKAILLGNTYPLDASKFPSVEDYITALAKHLDGPNLCVLQQAVTEGISVWKPASGLDTLERLAWLGVDIGITDIRTVVADVLPEADVGDFSVSDAQQLLGLLRQRENEDAGLGQTEQHSL